jgi:hypothetical protein
MEHVLIVAETAPQLRIVVWLVFGERRTLRASFVAGTLGGPAFRVLAVPGGVLMTATTSSTALATIQPAFTDAERLALAGFLAGYRGLTREAYTLDLRQFTSWCRIRSLSLFAVRRADIETFARELEARGRARATVTRRLCTIAGFYKYAVEEELLEHSPAAHVRRPRLDYESHATARHGSAGSRPVAHQLADMCRGSVVGSHWPHPHWPHPHWPHPATFERTFDTFDTWTRRGD